jgi:hypothetical protein
MTSAHHMEGLELFDRVNKWREFSASQDSSADRRHGKYKKKKSSHSFIPQVIIECQLYTTVRSCVNVSSRN